MQNIREVKKVGLALVEGNRILLVRKRGSQTYILPGGKPEAGEDDIEALARELDEELGCSLDLSTVTFLGSFSDKIADEENATVTVRLYSARLIGNPAPQSEIEEMLWLQATNKDTPLAPSLTNKIIPYLISNGRLHINQRTGHSN
jgi:8-oxo-dGTP diphosphatase